MFLLNHELTEIENLMQQEFTIQNVSIKLKKEIKEKVMKINLQYKMFLLNLIFLKLPI